jgi:DNA polymerase, archaea type
MPGLDGHVLFGCDPTRGIVSVDADRAGRARVWRRAGDTIEATEHRFPNWFLTTELDLLADLPARSISANTLRAAHGQLEPPDLLSIVELDWPYAANTDVYRYLVLTSSLDEVETALVEMSNKHDGGDAQTLADLRGLVLAWHPIEQFLALSGRTYFKGLTYADLRRFQFDLETTGLDEDRDRMFMISMRDSSGWHEVVDTTSLTEAGLIEHLVQAVQEHDPDVLENHNIFAFDLSFLVKRAARLGVRLALGRDGSEPWVETDAFDTGERAEPFLRWRVAGREVVDTQHAVRRFGVTAPDMRRHGLKEAARYFGLASPDREYVAGADVWPTFRDDPDRIRRYASSDVDEVDGLSRRLLPPAFGLATMVPRAYERIAADCSPAALWELLLVRAYLHAGRAIAAPMPHLQRPAVGRRSELFLTGVVGAGARAVVQPLLPSVLADNAIAATNDDLSVMPGLLRHVLRRPDDESSQALAAVGHAYLAGTGLFSDPDAASEASGRAREYVDRLLADLRARGCRVIDVDGEQITFATPAAWTAADERDAAEVARGYLPGGVSVTYPGHFQAVYARAPHSAIVLGQDGGVTLIGSFFRPGRLERYGEAFLQRVAASALLGDAVGLRRAFLHTVHRLRTAQFPLEDLCVQVVLHKSLPLYRRSASTEEPYEVLLRAGVRTWRVGQRIRYFRARDGEPRLLREGDAHTPADADADYYVQRLCTMYCRQFTQAYRPEDFSRIFRLPPGAGPFEEPEMDAELGGVRTVCGPMM